MDMPELQNNQCYFSREDCTIYIDQVLVVDLNQVWEFARMREYWLERGYGSEFGLNN